MAIPVIHVKWPRAALRFLLRQAALLNPLQSRQQEILITIPTAGEIHIWNQANPLDICHVDVGESQTFYPSGGIVFWMLETDDPAPPPADDSRCNLIAQIGWTNTQCRDSFVAQINAYAAAMHGPTNGYYDTLHALPGTGAADLRLLMPIGTNGSPTHLTHTAGPESLDATLRFTGFSRALAYGIIGPRRHVFAVPLPVPPEQPG